MVVAYKTPQQFLDETESLLEKKELENNLILGICNQFTNKTAEQENCVFINSVRDHQIKASSIKTADKAIVSGISREVAHLKELADYYLENKIALKGVFGENFFAKKFSDFYDKEYVTEMTLILHQLISVNNLAPAPGRFKMAGKRDIAQITDWTLQFEKDAKATLVHNREQILQTVQERTALGNIFKWTDQGKILSIAAINRKTKNSGIVGLVFTPEEYRGKGYATSLVQKLSEYILQKGFKYCGLFTDKANPASNHIYQKIGYKPVTEFTDTRFREF
jgi:uncharacterized protein